MLFSSDIGYWRGRIEGYEVNQVTMRDARAAASGLLSSIFFLVIISPIVINAEESGACCNSQEFDLFIIGDSDSGQLTPFDSKLTEEKTALVTSSLLGEDEVGSWGIEWGSSGDYPAGTWNFNIPYEVVEASGVSANATVLVKVGGSSYQSSAQLPGVFLSSTGVLQIPVEVESGSIAKGDKIEVSFSLRSVIFNSPNSDSGILFLWGSDQNDASLTLYFPLVEVVIKDVNVKGDLFFFPVTITSGFSDEMWTRSLGGLTVQGNEVSDSPIVTEFDGGAEVTFVWEAPSEFSGTQVNSKFHLTPQSGLLIEAEKTHQVNSGENYGDDSWYPEEEPSRKGLSKLDVVVNCELVGTSIERETTIRFDGAMSQWTRWGLDNIGDSGLGSSSWWNNLNSYSNTISDVERQNGRVDDSELDALQRHLKGSKTDLGSFLSSGLMIQPDSLFGADPVAFGPLDVSINLGKSRAFSSEQISITISSSYSIEGERQTLIEDFVKPGGYDFWEIVGISLEIRTGMLAGLGGVYSDSDVIEYDHRRWVIMEILTINSVELEADEEFRLEISADNTLIFSPLISAMISVFAICVAVGIGIAMTKRRTRAPSMIMVGVMGILTFSIYWFGLPMQIVLGLVSSSVLLVFPVAMISPINESAETDRTNSNAGRVKCPSCGKKNPVESNVRPLRMDCIGCGSTLRLE